MFRRKSLALLVCKVSVLLPIGRDVDTGNLRYCNMEKCLLLMDSLLLVAMGILIVAI